MTSISPINANSGFSKGKKAAAVSSATVGTIAAATAAAAFVIGKGKVEATGLRKVLPAIKEGYKTMGKFVTKTAGKVWSFITDKFNTVKNFVAEKLPKKAA